MAQTRSANWPPLPYSEWRDTAATLHLWLQIVGKIAMVQRAWVNHSWHVALRTTARGIGTGLIPHEAGSFQIDFDFIDAQSRAARQRRANGPLAVAPAASRPSSIAMS